MTFTIISPTMGAPCRATDCEAYQINLFDRYTPVERQLHSTD
jgi:hypothetical protein